MSNEWGREERDREGGLGVVSTNSRVSTLSGSIT